MRIDLQTSDLVLAGNYDLAVSADFDVIAQRIHNRLMMDRGSFIYDRPGTLGSRLRTVGTRVPMLRSKEGINLLVREALEPMSDITVTAIEIDNIAATEVEIRIAYKQNSALVETGNSPFEGQTALTLTVASDV